MTANVGVAAMFNGGRVGGAAMRGAGVKVGKGVGLGTGVGGSGVLVGIAACVAATMVHAAATEVPWISADDMVGVGCGPHAVTKTASGNRMGNIFFSIFLSVLFLNLFQYFDYCFYRIFAFIAFYRIRSWCFCPLRFSIWETPNAILSGGIVT
jgi:hypothetical protein